MKGFRKTFVIAGILCLILCVLLTGCKKSDTDEPDNSTVTTASPEPTPSPSPSTSPPVQSEAPKTELIGTVIDVTNGVNIRSGPSTESDVLGIAELGAQFKVLKAYYTSEWHKIEYEDGVAYISAQYLEITEVPVTTDTAD